MTRYAVNTTEIMLRLPAREDAIGIWKLIRSCPPLDVNSSYMYLLLCEHNPQTCVVAERDGAIVGFVSGYRLPADPTVLFIWQVAVHPDGRGLGLGKRMIVEILGSSGCDGVMSLETTVSPSNQASRKMFSAIADTLSSPINEKEYFSSALLGESGHEPENLITIGPFGDGKP